MTQQPNIIHFFTDQLRYDAIGAHGNTEVKTPHIDSLVNNGVTFSNAFSPSPVCIAARCSMIFGQYPSNTECYENTVMPTDNRRTFMKSLAENGYHTHGVGKCHFTPDPDAMRGFNGRDTQEELRLSPDKDDYLTFLHRNGYQYICDPHGVRGDMYYIPQVSQLPADYHPTQWVGDRSIDFITKEGEKSDPWYLFTSFVHPHPPFAPPNPWHKLYQSSMLNLPNIPAQTEDLLTYVNKAQNRYKYRDQGTDYHLFRLIKAYYYACVSFIDYQVGRIIDTLQKTKQMDNTVIIFTSDHGEYLGDYRCFGKRGMHDPAAKIPLIISNPTYFPKSKVCETPASLVDIAPTLLDISGSTIKTHRLDGTSLRSILDNNVDDRYVFSQHSYQYEVNLLKRKELPQRSNKREIFEWMTSMVVNKRWKYFYCTPDDREFLFDKKIDTRESQNKAGLRFTDTLVKEFRNKLFKFLQDNGDEDAIEDGEWRRFTKKVIPSNLAEGLLIQDHPWAQTHIEGYSDNDINMRIYDTGVGEEMK